MGLRSLVHVETHGISFRYYLAVFDNKDAPGPPAVCIAVKALFNNRIELFLLLFRAADRLLFDRP